MDLERQFLRYRDAGDADALGRVFDRAAPTLLRIARHVAGARETAPDLVQATFLTAIEKASSYDPARPLLPWLTGILVRHAAWARRRSGRTPDPERVDLPLPRDPADLVSERELEGEVDRALRTLPERYRPLVEARLRDDARGVDLARRSGRSPGVVRMQLHRGLERLRRALPASLLPSLAFLLGSRRALAAARAEVLARAGAPGSAAAAPVPALVGGTLVANKTILTGGAVLAAGAAWLLSRDGGPLPVPAAPPPVTVDAERATATFPVVAPARVPAAATVDAPLPVDATDRGGGVPFPDAYVASLTGVTGRLVEPDGAPVAGTAVALVEARPGELVAEVGFAFGEAGAAPRLEAARTTTDAEGRFTLAGAHARGVHALSIDPAGARATLRLLDVALRPGAVTDLGDVVLAAGVRLTGRIVDEDDRPIEGARVRVAAVPFPVALFGAEHWREGARIVRLHRDPTDHAVFAPPAWIEAQTRRLPIAAARTGADGRFVVERAPRGVLTLAADADDRPAPVFPPVPSGGGATRDVGTLVLPPGRAVEGVVRDAAGAPVAGATVIGGVVPPAGRVVVAPHEVVTDGDGRFVLAPLPEGGAVVAAARR
ncbi:MAG: sigma-70 family RNA polymerase sigma factor, partial [Planctomycetota bacterium JB042]